MGQYILSPHQRKQLERTIKTPELDDRDTLLERIGTMLEESKTLTKKDRWNPRRIMMLRQLERHLTEYQENLMAQQVTLKQMRTALDNELRLVGDRQSDRER